MKTISNYRIDEKGKRVVLQSPDAQLKEDLFSIFPLFATYNYGKRDRLYLRSDPGGYDGIRKVSDLKAGLGQHDVSIDFRPWRGLSLEWLLETVHAGCGHTHDPFSHWMENGDAVAGNVWLRIGIYGKEKKVEIQSIDHFTKLVEKTFVAKGRTIRPRLCPTISASTVNDIWTALDDEGFRLQMRGRAGLERRDTNRAYRALKEHIIARDKGGAA